MMYNLPLRRTILQSTLRFFIDALTFITRVLLYTLLIEYFFYQFPRILRSGESALKGYLYLYMIRPRLRSYGLISTPTLSPGNIRM